MNIIFDNIMNARDLGGLPAADGKTIKSGLLLRTALLQFATDNDIARLQNEYHLARVFDFRSFEETEFQPDRPVPGASHHILPTIDMRAEQDTGRAIPEEAFRDLEKYIVNYAFYPEVQRMAANMYPSLIRSEYSQLQYAAFLRLIVETPEGAVLWHCAQGKDRTGWGAAYLMFALGVPRDIVIRDFELSNAAYEPLVRRLNQDVLNKSGGKAEMAVIQAFMGVSTENFIATLNLIDREYGGIYAYLENQLFLTPDDCKLLQERYLF